MKADLSRRKRLLLGLALPLLLGLLALYEATDGLSIPCLFYELTGLYCPGCGSGRAVNALLRGAAAGGLRIQSPSFSSGSAGGVRVPAGIPPPGLPRAEAAARFSVPAGGDRGAAGGTALLVPAQSARLLLPRPGLSPFSCVQSIK